MQHRNDLQTGKTVEFQKSESGVGSSTELHNDNDEQVRISALSRDFRAQLSHISRKSSSAAAYKVAEDNVVQSNLDSRAVLKAFRLIGGVNGIQIEELRQRIGNVRAEHIRKPLLKLIDDMFTEHDTDCNGFLDVIEFEALVNSSTILQEAVYDILASVSQEEASAASAREVPIWGEGFELASMFVVLLNLLSIAIEVDNSPDWHGWRVFDLVFSCLYTIDVCVRFRKTREYYRYAHHQSDFDFFFSHRMLTTSPTSSLSLAVSRTALCPRKLLRRLQLFFSHPTNILDVVATLCAWVDVCINFSVDDADLRDHSFFWIVQQVRWVRFVRLLRLVHFMTYFRECGIFLIGIITGMQSVMWGLTLNALIVLIWAITIRQHVENRVDSDGAAILGEIFPSMPRSMHLIFRCMVLRADGFCVHTQHGHMLNVLSEQLGWFFDVLWLLSEFFLFFVVFNVITATFVMQAADNAKQLQERIHISLWQKDEVRLKSLDRLLRTLIYPARNMNKEQSMNNKDRYASQVSTMIKKDHPEAAARIPNLEREVVHFARSIQESKSLLQNAMNRYEAKEQNACRGLQNTPSAKTYWLEGQEVLMVDKNDASISNSFGIPAAPMSASEVMLVQEQDNFHDLLIEAEEVQEYVKTKFCPHSAWAQTLAAGYSGDIRKQSNRLCDEAMDPGVKEATRIEQKVTMKYGGRYDQNRDYCRLGLIYNSVAHLMEALPLFLKFSLASEGLQVASIENRFVHPHPLGWRDITILLKVLVPSSQRHHIMEVQLMLRGLTECRNESHHFYEEIRGLLPQDVVMTILDRLVTDTTLDLGITQSEWLTCLHNKEVKQLLDELGVPSNCRKRLFDIVDIDDSGTVQSSELQEMLRLFRTPVQALELTGCHFRVREVQRNAQTKITPQLSKLHKHVIAIGSMLQDILQSLIEFQPDYSKPNREERSSKKSTARSGDLATRTPISLPAMPHPSTPQDKPPSINLVARSSFDYDSENPKMSFQITQKR